MVNAYDVLGVAAGADRGEIRAAYVNLAKQLHPDRNTGSLNAEQRLREVNQAYELLKDPERRSAHDQLLQQRRGQASRRRKHTAAVMAASFAVTAAAAAVVLLLARFSLLDDTVQASGSSELIRSSGDQGLALRMASLDAAVEAARELPAQIDRPTREDLPSRSPSDEAGDTLVGQRVTPLQTQDPPGGESVDTAPQHEWITYHNDRFGFAIDYPADVFTADDRALGDFWRLFVSRDGQARLLVTAGFNSKRLSTASYRQAVLNETYQGASLEYAPVRKTWFVLAGSKDEEGFYERATFACDGRIIHRWRLTYPANARETYSKIIERIHLGYKHIRGAGPHCG
jgi:curved DNA-binding protein CbpA